MQNNISSQIQQLEQQLQKQLDICLSPSHGSDPKIDPENLLVKLENAMKIFLNSLKLNQKLYYSIIQKQNKISTDTNIFIDITKETDHKIQDLLKRTKQLYEETVHQNQKSKFLLEQLMQPIRQQIQSKVDQTIFSLQIKMLLDQYDIIGHQLTYKFKQEYKTKDFKSKSVNSETLSFFRDRILPVISEMQKKFQHNNSKNQQYLSKLEEMNSKLSLCESEIYQQRSMIEELQKKNQNKINHILTEQTTNKKMMQSIELLMAENSKGIEAKLEKSKKFSNSIAQAFREQFQKMNFKIQSFISNHQATEFFFKSLIQKQQTKLQQESKITKQNFLGISQIKNKLQTYDQNIKLVPKLHQKFQALNSKLQNGDFKSHYEFTDQYFNSLLKKLNEFEVQAKKIKKFQKQIEQKNLILKGELQSIRDILSKKANFSDILIHFQNKVDRQDLNQVRRIIEEGKNFKSEGNTNQNYPAMKDCTMNNLIRKRSIKSRKFFSPSPVEKQNLSQFEPQELKRFKLGFNTEFFVPAESRRQYLKTHCMKQTFVNPNNSCLQKEQIQN